MTIQITAINKLPKTPAVYALYGGQDQKYVAYVGMARKLRDRINQHLVRRDSSVTTGTSAASLLPDNITEVHWWEHPDFTDHFALEAAELVAFDVLEPSLRSRGAIQERIKQYFNDAAFHQKMKDLFASEPTGCLIIPNLQSVLNRVEQLEKRIDTLEQALAKK